MEIVLVHDLELLGDGSLDRVERLLALREIAAPVAFERTPLALGHLEILHELELHTHGALRVLVRLAELRRKTAQQKSVSVQLSE